MERKDFLKSSLGMIGLSTLIVEACKKDATGTTTGNSGGTGSCIVTQQKQRARILIPAER